MSITLNKELSAEKVRKYQGERYLGSSTQCSPDEMTKKNGGCGRTTACNQCSHPLKKTVLSSDNKQQDTV
ncbi:hypothetical protein ACFPRA_15455 [Sporosarcina soli]|uniref:Lantibiotic n=1 Tax=Sporosarcina soli TaxID=334736 RepID=A0ABW0TPA5_9BACL